MLDWDQMVFFLPHFWQSTIETNTRKQIKLPNPFFILPAIKLFFYLSILLHRIASNAVLRFLNWLLHYYLMYKLDTFRER